MMEVELHQCLVCLKIDAALTVDGNKVLFS